MLLEREMSKRQEVGVINVKHHCHKATNTLNVTQTPAWLTQLSYPVDSNLYSDFCIARDCFMILMLRSFQFNALSCGNRRPNLLYKKACRDIFGGFSVHQSLPETLPLATGINNSLTTICIFFFSFLFSFLFRAIVYDYKYGPTTCTILCC